MLELKKKKIKPNKKTTTTTKPPAAYECSEEAKYTNHVISAGEKESYKLVE